MSNGVLVINHSVGWVNQNFYDGTCYENNTVCTADTANYNGILWVNSAGNAAQMHYEATFTDSDADGWHEVSGSDEFITLSANENDVIRVFLTWNAWPTTDQDYDLYLYDSSMNQVDISQNPQTGTEPPTEAISYGVPSTGTYYLKIREYNATFNHQLEVYSFNHQLNPAVSSSSLMNPADASGVMAVAAIQDELWTTGGQEPYSSQGPTNDIRTKPEISGPDGVSNYTYGSFYGTSAASPHVAGAAALVLSKNSGYSVYQLWNALTGSAIDMGTSGQDNIYGYGRLNLPELCPDNFSAGNGNSSLQYAKSLKGGIQEAYGKLPLYFVRNNGQMDDRVRFYEKGIGHATFFTDEGVFVSLESIKKPDVLDKKPEGLERKTDIIALTPLNVNKNPVIIAEGEQEGKVNYFLGNEPNKWKTHIPTYKGVLYKEVYDGIDIRYYGNNQQLEYDIIVKPGADPGVVKFSYEGIEDLSVTEDGDLEIALEKGNIVQKRPYVYQDIDGKRVEIDGSFVILDNELSLTEGSEEIDMNKKQGPHFSYAFEIAAYDTKHPLIIDPTLVYSTYLGGSDLELGYDIATDISGNAYITGGTYSSDFPLDSPIQGTCASCNVYPDVFVTKINSAGDALLYSTYLGGGSEDWGYGIAVDTSGNAYITGYTSSSDFPLASPIQGALNGPFDAFVTKINASGSAISYSTYMGGNSWDNGEDIAVDAYGNAYITGPTYSTDFPLSSPIQGYRGGEHDAFITKINNSGNAFIYSTYLGGSSTDYGVGIAADTFGNAYVTGVTMSSDFPIYNPLQGTSGGSNDVFVTEINTTGNSLIFSTYLGGSNDDAGYGIAVDTYGNAFITGKTYSSDFPVASPIQATCASCLDEYPDAFVTKIETAGYYLLFSTYLGGIDEDYGNGIAVDRSGDAYIAGSTRSDDFPVLYPVQGNLGGVSDSFVTKIETSNYALSYSTYLGGGQGDNGRGIAVDICKDAYVTGATGSSDFPLASPIQGTLNGSADAFITKIDGGP